MALLLLARHQLLERLDLGARETRVRVERVHDSSEDLHRLTHLWVAREREAVEAKSVQKLPVVFVGSRRLCELGADGWVAEERRGTLDDDEVEVLGQVGQQTQNGFQKSRLDQDQTTLAIRAQLVQHGQGEV